MSVSKRNLIASTVLLILLSTLLLSPTILAQDENNDAKVIERYKVMLKRKPREGSSFDRLYQFYLEGDGLTAMVSDYEEEAKADPDDANIQLLLGHIHKRLGNDTDALAAYQRAVELAPNDYYTYFALGQLNVALRKHEEAIPQLSKAASLSDQTKSVSPEELTTIYKTLGNAFFNRDRLDDAIKAWNKISELDPQNIFARIELADLYREKELYKQAISQHEAIIQIKADDPYRICLSLREIGKIHEETGKFKEAQDSYDKALALTAPGNWLRKDLQHRIIAIYAADANWTDLITYYQDKLQKDANDTEMLGLLAAAYIENEQLDEGIQTYKRGLELSPSDNSLRLNLIAALRNAEKLADAALEYETITQQQPDNFGIYRELGKIYLELQNEEKARAVYQRMIDRDPTNASTFLTLAEIYTGHEWVEDAATAYQKAISLAPENLDYIEYYGKFYYRQGNGEKAIETWHKMVEADKKTAENYDRLARLLDSQEFKKEAIEASKKAVELMPDTYRFREAYAKRLMEHSKYDEALQEYTQALELAPNDFFAEQMDDQRIELYKRNGTIIEKIEKVETQLTEDGITDIDKRKHLQRLAKMYIKIGNSTYALEILLKAKELQPDDINMNRWIANIYVKQGLRDEAIEIYKHLTTIDTKNAREYYANMTNAYLKGFDFEESTEAARQVIAHSPRNPEGHQLLAQIAKQSGEYEQAIGSYKQAIRLRPEIIENRIELAAIYSLTGKYREAVAQYWRCWELSDNINEKLKLLDPLTNAYYDLGRHEELEEKLKQMAKTNSTDISPVLALAQVHRTEGDLPSARFQIARALDRQQDNPDLLTQFVDINIDLGDIQAALDHQEKLVKVNPDPIHRQKLGELLFDLGRVQEAIQTWSKVLHAKNLTLEAEVKFAHLLIRHGLREEALSALDSAGEEISGKDAHLTLYQLGTTLQSMNEPKSAIPHFKRVLAMNKPIEESISSVSTITATPTVTQSHYGPPGINLNRLNLASILTNVFEQNWKPSTFEEAQSAALLQLASIMMGEGKLDELIHEYEYRSQVNPKDIQNLELLAQLYGLLEDNDLLVDSNRSERVIEKLLAATPNDPLYQSINFRQDVLNNQLNFDEIMQRFDSMQWLSPQAKQWFLADFIQLSNAENYQGPKDNVENLLNELAKEAVDTPSIIPTLVNAYVSTGRTAEAEELITAELAKGSVYAPKIIPMLVNLYISMDRAAEAEELITESIETATPQMLQQFSKAYQRLASIHHKMNEVDKAVVYYWKYFELTKPKSTNPSRALTHNISLYPSGGSPSIQSGFPSKTIYYDQSRLRYLQEKFYLLWINDQHEALYNHLKTEIEKTEGRDRIYPALALCYCYWWENNRDAALEILTGIEREFPDDITLKLMTTQVTIQTGKHKEALKRLQDLTQADPRNRRQYFDLTLQIAVNSGDTVAVRELMTKVLNSPRSVRELYQFSKQLQQAGLTQYAIAVAKKTTTLALRERDPNFLLELSRHLSNLGRGQDAAKIASRIQQATNLARRSIANSNRNRVTKLLKAVKDNPNSFPAQIELATYYASKNQNPEASTAYEAALELRPKDHKTRTQYIAFLERNRQYKKAIKHYTILSEQGNIEALDRNHAYDVMRTFTEAEELAKLVEITKAAIPSENRPTSGYYFARTVAERLTVKQEHKYTVKQKNKYAVEIYEKMMEISTNTNRVILKLADAYVTSGNRDNAIQLLRQKLEIEGTNNKIDIIIKSAKFTELTEDLKALSTKYDSMIETENVEPVLLYLTAITKIVTKDLEGSDAIVDRLLEVIPTTDKLTWLTTIANAYLEQADVDREIRILKASLIDVDPVFNYSEISDVYKQLGTAYTKKGENDIAKDYIKKMGTIQLLRSILPSNQVKESVARIYLQHELFDEAEVLLTEIINDFSIPSPYMWLKTKAEELLSTLEVRRAEKNNKTTFEKQMSLAHSHQNAGKFDEAIKAYEKAIQLTKHDWQKQDVERQMLAILKQQGKLEEYVKEAEKKGTLTFLMKLELARQYLSKGESEKAIKAYKDALEISAKTLDFSWYAYRELLLEYLRIGEDDAAVKLYYSILKQTGSWTPSVYGGPNGYTMAYGDDSARQTIITEFKNSGRLDKLRTILEGRLEKNKSDPINLEIVAEIYRKTGNHEKAAQTYQALTNASPNSVRAYFYAAAESKKMGNLELADQLINHGNTVLSSDNRAQDRDFLCTISSICYTAKLYEPAIKYLKQALILTHNQHPVDRKRYQETIYPLIGKSALALKQYEEAVKAYTHLLSITTDSKKKEEAENAIRKANKEGKLQGSD